jgi:hypothetical protein
MKKPLAINILSGRTANSQKLIFKVQVMIIDTARRTKQTSEYYFSVKLAEVRKLIAEGHDVINLGIGNPDMMPSEETINRTFGSCPETAGAWLSALCWDSRISQCNRRFLCSYLWCKTWIPLPKSLPLIGIKRRDHTYFTDFSRS